MYSPKICFVEQHWLQFFCHLNFRKKFTCLLGKLRTEFVSPVLSDKPFFARWQIHLSPHVMLLGESTLGKTLWCHKKKLVWSFPDHQLNSNGDSNDDTYTVNYSYCGHPCSWKLVCIITSISLWIQLPLITPHLPVSLQARRLQLRPKNSILIT